MPVNNKRIKLYGKEITKGIFRDWDFLKQMDLPVRMLLNKNGTIKKAGARIDKIKLKQENGIVIKGRLKKGKFDYAPSVSQALYNRIEKVKKSAIYRGGSENRKALLEEGILVKDPDSEWKGGPGEITHGPNGFSFSKIIQMQRPYFMSPDDRSYNASGDF